MTRSETRLIDLLTRAMDIDERYSDLGLGNLVGRTENDRAAEPKARCCLCILTLAHPPLALEGAAKVLACRSFRVTARLVTVRVAREQLGCTSLHRDPVGWDEAIYPQSTYGFRQRSIGDGAQTRDCAARENSI